MVKQSTYLLLGIVLLLIAFLTNISLGSVSIPLDDVLAALFGGDVDKESWRYIITDYRLPKALTAIFVGSGLALSGLLMQTLFRNPLAGPYVLGISSGASLGVAIIIMGASLFGGVFASYLNSGYSIAVASSLLV